MDLIALECMQRMPESTLAEWDAASCCRPESGTVLLPGRGA
jgi:hypothetical protein